jgi:hypothetical protein
MPISRLNVPKHEAGQTRELLEDLDRVARDNAMSLLKKY